MVVGGRIVRAQVWAMVISLVATLLTVVPAGRTVEASTMAPLSPYPMCVDDSQGNPGLGCYDDEAGSTSVSGTFRAGGTFDVTTDPSAVGPCSWYLSTGCHITSYNPSIVRCVYLHDDDATDVRSCGSLSTQGSVSASRVGNCYVNFGNTYATGGDARYPSTWYTARFNRGNDCEFEVSDARPIDNLRGPTFFLVRTSVRECVALSGGWDCTDLASANTYRTVSEYAWVPVQGTLAPRAKFTPRFLTEGDDGTKYLMENKSSPFRTGTTTYEWDFGDGETSTATSPVHTYADEGVYTVTLTMRSSEGPTLTDSEVIDLEPPDEDELVVTVTIEPEEVTLPVDGAGVPVPDDSVVATVNVKNVSDDDVTNVSLDGQLATSLEAGDDKAITQVGDPVPAPAGGTGKVELGTIATGTSRDVTYMFEVSDVGIFGVEALVLWADPDTAATDRAFAEDTVVVETGDGLEIELAGATTASPNVVEVTATIRNLSDSETTGLDWGDGLWSEVFGADPLVDRTGPIPSLPTSLASGAQQMVRWTYEVNAAGIEVFTLAGKGTNDDGDVAAFEQLTADVSDRLVEEADITRAAADGLVETFREMREELQKQWDASIAEISQKTGFANETEAFRRREIDGFKQLGFSDTTARFLASGRVQRQALANYFNGYLDGGSEAINQLGQSDGEALWKFWDTISDSDKASAFFTGLVEKAKTEAGYLADGYANPNTPLLLETAYGDLRAAGIEVRDSFAFAAVGQVDLWRIDAQKAIDDPLGLGTEVGKRHGGQQMTAAYYTAVGTVEEVLTGGLATTQVIGATDRLLEGGVDALRTNRRASAGAETGSDAFGQATRQFAESEDVVLRFQDLPYGSTLDLDELARLGGIDPTDAPKIQALVDSVKNTHGVDVEIVFRTAEPFSAGIDGVGKRAFTKEKAVGAMDIMLGAPVELKGKVAIFKPQPLPSAVVDAMDFDNPGFKKQYTDRYNTQLKNWNAFNDGTARTLNVLDGSSKYGGVHVFDGVPGQKLYGVDYLEQLDDPAYLATRPDLTPAQIDELRQTPATFTNMELDVVDGAFTLSDNVKLPDGTFQKKPIISDYDAQSVRPVDGDWKGKRGQIETQVHADLKEIGRYGRHGWSDAAHDLPADLFHLPAEYVMSTTHPAAAGRVSRDLSRRFGVLAEGFRAKADRLAALPATPARTAEIAKLRKRAAEFDKYTPEEILKRWPPGEKTVVFSSGRISVGSNQGSNP